MTTASFKQDILKWAVKDENGYVVGLKPDAPEAVKKEYEKYIRAQKELNPF